MLNITPHFEKTALCKGQTEAVLMLELAAGARPTTKDQVKANNGKTALNVCFVIDTSGSMGETVQGKPYQDMSFLFKNQPQPIAPQAPLNPLPSPYFLGTNIPQPPILPHITPAQQRIVEQISYSTKLDKAKEAVLAAIETMEDGSFVSVVKFDTTACVVVEHVALSASSRAHIEKQVHSIHLGGSTDLHAGWVLGATQVAHNIRANSLNRVIVLTDGQVNMGITNPAKITQDVRGLCENGITTTTFGLGLGFNEDLLQAMAIEGSGNFYYSKNGLDLKSTFIEEFSSLGTTCMRDVIITLDMGKKVNSVESLNGYSEVKVEGNNSTNKKSYSVASLQWDKKIFALFKITLDKSCFNKSKKKNTNTASDTGELSLGKVVVSYKDMDGIERSLQVTLKTVFLEADKWATLPTNQELKVQQTLLAVAQTKIDATKAIDAGNIMGACGMLAASSNMLRSVGIQDARLQQEEATLSQSLATGAQDTNAFRKDMINQSYQTRYSK